MVMAWCPSPCAGGKLARGPCFRGFRNAATLSLNDVLAAME